MTFLAPGMVLGGRYTVVRALRDGGMGAVFEGRHRWTGRAVAIKVMRPELTRYKDLEGRFAREAQIAVAARHPNLVEVLDLDRDPETGSLFIVQELLEGYDMAQLLEQRRSLGVDEALKIVVPVMGALMCLHQGGVIHRDIKPENIFLTKSPSGGVGPKLIDFGTAKDLNAPPSDGRKGAPMPTAAHQLLGTAPYMSPEQTWGAAETDERSDLWSLGVVLYEAISGVLPFKGDSLDMLYGQIRAASHQRLDKRVRGAPKALSDVIERALRKDRDQRYKSVQHMLGALLDCEGTGFRKRWHTTIPFSAFVRSASRSGVKKPSGQPIPVMDVPPPVEQRPTVEASRVATRELPPPEARDLEAVVPEPRVSRLGEEHGPGAVPSAIAPTRNDGVRAPQQVQMTLRLDPPSRQTLWARRYGRAHWALAAVLGGLAAGALSAFILRDAMALRPGATQGIPGTWTFGESYVSQPRASPPEFVTEVVAPTAR